MTADAFRTELARGGVDASTIAKFFADLTAIDRIGLRAEAGLPMPTTLAEWAGVFEAWVAAQRMTAPLFDRPGTVH